jgi:hypothetical protein
MVYSASDAEDAGGQSRKRKGRKTPSEREILDILFAQGIILTCPDCGEPITDRKNIARDHTWSIATGGPDIASNMRYVHQTPCHDIKTRGSGATTAGTDVGVAAKMKRLARKREVELGLRAPKKKKKIPGRGFPSKEERAALKERARPLGGAGLKRQLPTRQR